jgi:C-terminal processing protease CtpA/Prc
VPDSLLKYLSTWNKAFKQPKNDKDFVKNELDLYEKIENSISETISPQTTSFVGKVYLITDSTNSSSTFEMAKLFRKNNLGEIIGEPTGGTKQGLNGGEMFFLTLPNSKFEIDLPIVYWYHKGEPDEGVMPDFVIKKTTESIRSNRDMQLEFILKID